jgi:hypothetical protein
VILESIAIALTERYAKWLLNIFSAPCTPDDEEVEADATD